MKIKIIKYQKIIIGLILVTAIVLLDQANYFGFVSHPILNFLGKDYLQALLFIPMLVWVMSQIWAQVREDINRRHLPGEILFVVAILIGSVISYLAILNHQLFYNFAFDLRPIFGILATLILVKLIIIEYTNNWQGSTFLQREMTLSEIKLRRKAWVLVGLVLLTSFMVTGFWLYLFKPTFDVWVSVLLSSLLIIPSQVLLIALSGLISQTINHLKNNKVEIINQNKLPDIADLKMIIFDQIGTLMTTKLKVTNLAAAKPSILLKLSASLEQNLDHPIALALLEEAKRKKVKLEEVDKLKYYPGLGVVGWVKNQKIVLGNMALMRQENIVVGVLQREKSRLEKLGSKVIILGISYKSDRAKQTPGEVIGLITLSREVRPGVRDLIGNLHQLGIKTWVLTGESQVSAEVTGWQLGIDADHVLAGVLPTQKQAIVQELTKRGRANRVLAVVGGTEARQNNLFMRNNIGIYLGDNDGVDDKNIDVTIQDGQLKRLGHLLEVAISVANKTNQNQLWFGVYGVVFILGCWGLLNFKPINLIFWPVPAILLSGLITIIILFNSSLYLNQKGE